MHKRQTELRPAHHSPLWNPQSVSRLRTSPKRLKPSSIISKDFLDGASQTFQPSKTLSTIARLRGLTEDSRRQLQTASSMFGNICDTTENMRTPSAAEQCLAHWRSERQVQQTQLAPERASRCLKRRCLELTITTRSSPKIYTVCGGTCSWRTCNDSFQSRLDFHDLKTSLRGQETADEARKSSSGLALGASAVHVERFHDHMRASQK